MAQMINKSIPLQIKSEGAENTISAYLTTFNNPDVVNDIMAKGSLDGFIAKFDPKSQKLPMFYEHDHTSIIGEWTDLKQDDYGVMGTGTLYTETTKGSDVYNLMKRDAVSSVSIGFRSNDFEKNDQGGRTFNSISLVETSVVLRPANDRAQIVSVKSEDGMIETAALKKHLIEGGLTKSECEALFLSGWKGLKNLREADAHKETLAEALAGFKL
jgi:HK97 family phage prohead protease